MTDTEPPARPAWPRRLLATVDRTQQRIAPLAFVVGVARKFSDDRAGRAAALVAYYGFFSLFPLLLVAMTIVGFVFKGGERDWLRDSALAQIPVIGDQLRDQVKPLQGSVTALVVGLVGALWAGLGCMQAAQDGLNAVWGLPRHEHPNFFTKRLRSLGALAVVSLTLVVGAAATQVATLVPGVPGFGRVAGLAVSILLNAGLFALAFQVLAARRQRWRQLLPGGLLAGVGYSVLQVAGQWFVRQRVSGATTAYGTFAVVIGLLTWLYLLAQLCLVSAEVIVVRAERLWPRSLTGPPTTEADRRVAERIMAVHRMDRPDEDPADAA
jgi:inner membrane protein YhjD